MLWEKRKFITETFYCITLGQIAEAFYHEIAACQAQWAEWQALYHLDDPATPEGRVACLKTHPTLVLDTRRFAPDFVDRLLASFDDPSTGSGQGLDEMTDGLLVHGENWQAINLLATRYQEHLNCIHIDPPYNTDASGFVYKNAYRHSSWLSMMMERILASKRLVQADGTLICHIDENEYERLRLLLEQMFGYVGTAVWDKLNPMMGARELAIQHEYVVFCASEARALMVRPQNVRRILSMATSLIHKHGGVTESAKNEFNEWVRQAEGLTGGERAYQYLDENGHVYRLVAMTWPNPKPPPPEFFRPLIHPVTGKPCPVPNRGWSQSPRRMQVLLAEGKIVFGPDETTQPQRKVHLSENKALSSVIRDGSRGKKELESLGLDFTYSHPATLYVTLLDAGLGSQSRDSLVLDHFAGSGTTGHAVINLNREDGGRRRFILVEMADYVDTVLLPRLKKVTFTPEWKDGQPRRMATAEEAERSPRLMKVIRLESYEDALNNIAFDAPSGQQAMQFDDYLLQYMLRWETRASETLLNVEQLARPFAYQLHIHRDGQTRAQAVDLPETFNYLLGLHVQTRRVHNDEGRRYLVYRGVTREGRKTAVIWRDTVGWEQANYERDKQFVAERRLAEGADEVYINGDSFIPGARALEGLFKARLFAEVEA
jgi:adenine-specific DNA-methyltransferase